MRLYQGYIFDLDGTVYLGAKPLPTAVETITALRQLGAKTVFLSNKPIEPVSKYVEKLRSFGLPTLPGEVINSAVVMARYLARQSPGARLYVIGEPPLIEELQRAGLRVSQDPRGVDYLIVSWDRQFNYQKIQDALIALKSGARFLATHPDRTCPVEGGEVPDAGAMIGAIEGVSGKKVELVVGKPSPLTLEVALNYLGLPPEQCLMVGDRLETDIRMAREAGLDAALVLTGVTQAASLANSPWSPTYVLTRLADLLPAEMPSGTLPQERRK